jgi:hypothetical protein
MVAAAQSVEWGWPEVGVGVAVVFGVFGYRQDWGWLAQVEVFRHWHLNFQLLWGPVLCSSSRTVFQVQQQQTSVLGAAAAAARIMKSDSSTKCRVGWSEVEWCVCVCVGWWWW